MIAVKEEDRDIIRFLWVDDVKSAEPKVVKYTFTRVVFGVILSPFLLNATQQESAVTKERTLKL